MWCYINTNPADESVRSQLKDSEEMADENLEKLFEYPAVPWRYLTHSTLLSFHRRCKDTIVLTVLQPHQVCIRRTHLLSRSFPLGFLLLWVFLLLFFTVQWRHALVFMTMSTHKFIFPVIRFRTVSCRHINTFMQP